MARLTEAKVAEQVRKLRGNLAAVARAFGVTRTAVWEYVQARPALKAAVAEAREELVDNAESALAVAVAEREGWAVCFTLKCLGKARGYVERQEVELSGPGGGPLVTEVLIEHHAPAPDPAPAPEHPPDDGAGRGEAGGPVPPGPDPGLALLG